MQNLIPLPLSVAPGDGVFSLAADTTICVEPGNEALLQSGEYLASLLHVSTGFALPVTEQETAASSVVRLVITGADPDLGQEGYHLEIARESITISAPQPAGVFYGIQTLRQLLPPAVVSPNLQAGPWTVPTGKIVDAPRYAWRGMMLDVARHFFGVEDIKQLIDWLAYYKMNRLHLHLSDDQGWRLMIHSWPRLAQVGGSSAVGGEPGGYYTQEQYKEIAAYAQSRFVTIIPEIDLPGHTNAALASYAELNCDEQAPALYTGMEVGFSSLCADKEITYRFLEDVIHEVAVLTPGPYLHIGGDEAAATSPENYKHFIERVQDSVTKHGKHMIGWEEIAQAKLSSAAIAQIWNGNQVDKAIAQGHPLILSPASRTYIDMKYDSSTALGLNWAGYIEVQDSYDWDPDDLYPGLSAEQTLGIEAPLWSETLRTIRDVQYMVFPRIVSIAEIGWTSRKVHHWPDFRRRLGHQGPRWLAIGIDFYHSPQVEWEKEE